MTRRPFIVLCLVLMFCFPAAADEPKPDDRVIFDLSVEDWVTTKTAHVIVEVEAAVNGATAGDTRTDMIKAVDDLAKVDWRLTTFNRSQDQTGMERWSALFDARLPESDLSGLIESAKKLSKAGLQLTISSIDFSPTLDEMETLRGQLRSRIYKMANEQLVALNGALPGRNYRISVISFTGDENASPMPRVVRGQAAMSMLARADSDGSAIGSSSTAAPMERSEKIVMQARVILAALPEAKGIPAAPAVAPAPVLEQKH